MVFFCSFVLLFCSGHFLLGLFGKNIMMDEVCLQRIIRFLEQCHDELVTCIGSVHEEQEEYTVYEIEVR